MQSNCSAQSLSAGRGATLVRLLNSQSTPLTGTAVRRSTFAVYSDIATKVARDEYQPTCQSEPPPLAPFFPVALNQMPSSNTAIATYTNGGSDVSTQPGLFVATDTTTRQINEKGTVEEVVVKNGQVFHISFVDEPLPDKPNIVPLQSTTMPSLDCELSQLLDKSRFPESAIPASELDDSSSRDWINYDELPFLSLRDRSVSTATDQDVARPSSSRPPNKKSNQSETSTRCHSKRHNATYDENGNTFCGKTTTSKRLKNAEGVLSFNHYCVECVIFFPSVNALQAHMELEHRLIDYVPDSPIIAGNPTIPRLITSSKNCTINQLDMYSTFYCHKCALTLPLVETVQQHNSRVHGSDRSSSDR